MPLIRKTAVPVTAGPDLAAARAKLTGGTDDERWEAARALADSPDGASALGAALGLERNARVREAMFTGLARIATPACVDFVLPFVRSDDAQLRTGALDALRAMKTAINAYMPALLADADADVRLLACELARNLPGDDPARMLAGLLDAEMQPNVCAAAVEVLTEIGGPEVLPALDRCGRRFAGIPFLAFSIQLAADRIRSQSASSRA
jgi:hypothetical protein